MSRSGDLPGDFLYSAARLMLVTLGDVGTLELMLKDILNYK